MRELTRSALIGKPPDLIYALINDIEAYPQFVPWCTRAVIESRSEREIVATLGVRRGPLHTEFTTRNTLDPGRSVVMEHLRGPFKALHGIWTLTPIGDAGTRIELTLRFAFANRLTAAVFEPMFEETAGSLVDAFVARARTVAV
ncbi:MAG: type II toxin-antitoxin system RatA family toxin [Burkholderiales bacterium]|jgi:ribosome-associated toxin RatA of RatAB toxin-antitoxin module|nr:type II toxin-antitoxin system RatA family toxin [Burkholderiales bacterium]